MVMDGHACTYSDRHTNTVRVCVCRSPYPPHTTTPHHTTPHKTPLTPHHTTPDSRNQLACAGVESVRPLTSTCVKGRSLRSRRSRPRTWCTVAVLPVWRGGLVGGSVGVDWLVETRKRRVWGLRGGREGSSFGLCAPRDDDVGAPPSSSSSLSSSSFSSPSPLIKLGGRALPVPGKPAM
jgi:hypothetical protein